MSRSNAKSKMPTKANSRPSLSHVNARGQGELTGHPSTKATKEDTKYWKNREQELLDRISDLEKKLEGKPELHGSLDQKPEILVADKDSEIYKSRLETTEKESSSPNISKEENEGTEKTEIQNSDELIQQLKVQNEDLRGALVKMTAILRDKTALCVTQDKKITALSSQVESLKEVVAITKDLLNIRNMEVQHLSNDISSMESKIECERQRHNQMITKMDEAVKLNTELKKEYEHQLKIFQQLRDNYEEKVRLLSRESMNLTLENGHQNGNNQTVSGNERNTPSPTKMADSRSSNYTS